MDRRRVERILRNLLLNAVEHGENKDIVVTAAADSGAVAVSVRDFGVGLRPGEDKLVFDRFWRADPARARTSGGTGLGLAIALEDARLHGGWLEAWGEPGRGCVFRLTLPRLVGGELQGSPLPLNPDEVGEQHPEYPGVPDLELDGAPAGADAPAADGDAQRGRRPGGGHPWLAAGGCCGPRPSGPAPSRCWPAVPPPRSAAWLSGCQGSSGQQQQFVEPLPPPGPQVGETGTDVVTGFLHASASFAEDPAAAQAYLAPHVKWHPAGTVTIVRSNPKIGPTTRVPPTVSGQSVVVQIRVTGQRIATINPSGQYSLQAGAPTNFTFTLAKYGGKLLITQLPREHGPAADRG